MENSSNDGTKLTQITLPDQVFGSVKSFKNYDPSRIQHFELIDGGVHLYMSELDRLHAMQEYKSTVEAFRFEVDRRVRPETQSYKSFYYADDFSSFTFEVNKELFTEDVSSMMIERSIVEDAMRYQLYAKKKIGVHVIYKDAYSGEVIREKMYPKEIQL